MGKQVVRFTAEALKTLMDYGWPGNVRELENCIERGLVLCEDESLGLEYLPEKARRKGDGARGAAMTFDSLSIKRAEESVERDLIGRALEKTGGNRTHAARLLEISHRALLYKIKEYGME